MKTWETIKVFESFAGIGTQRMALKNQGIEHEVVAIAEVDEYALLSYHAIHTADIEVKEASEKEMQRYMEEKNIPLNTKGKRKILKNKRLKDLYAASVASNNLGDISKITDDEIPKVDLFTYSFPCQDISVAGKQKGLEEESGTRSSLLWECERIIKDKRPKYLLMENVKNLVGKRHKENFDKWLEILEGYGYTNYWQVLNAKDYGIPQNRERVFCISVLGEHSPYEFPEPFELELKLKDMLEDEVDEKFYLNELNLKMLLKEDTGNYPRKERFLHNINKNTGIANTIQSRQRTNATDNYVKIKNATKKGYIEATDGDGIDLVFLNSDTRRGRVQNGMSQTLDTGSSKGVINQFRVRKLTPLECWRLMGISDEDFYKAQKVNSNSQLYKQAGNAIVVDVLEGIFKQLFNPDEKDLER